MLRFVRRFHVASFDSRAIKLKELLPDDPQKSVRFRNLFLKDACPSHVDPSTHQKDFSTAQLDPQVYAVKANVENDTLNIDWNDGTQSAFPESFLQRYATVENRLKFRQLDHSQHNIWHKPDISRVFYVSYKDYMESKFAFSESLKQLQKDGLVFITDVPPDQKSVERIAGQVGYIKDTFYGRSWDVESTPEAKNVAYTSVYLPLHMDLLYYESPPGVQLLHVINNSTVGGESVFADAFAAAYHIKETQPEQYKALTSIPLTFHYLHDSDHYYYQRPLIVEKNGKIDHVNYSPPFQGPLDVMATDHDICDGDLAHFMRGLKSFEEFIETPQNQIEKHMPEGTCMVFMNRRILHGRRQFKGESGKRFFKGTYLDIDAFRSKLRTSSHHSK